MLTLHNDPFSRLAVPLALEPVLSELLSNLSGQPTCAWLNMNRHSYHGMGYGTTELLNHVCHLAFTLNGVSTISVTFVHACLDSNLSAICGLHRLLGSLASTDQLTTWFGTTNVEFCPQDQHLQKNEGFHYELTAACLPLKQYGSCHVYFPDNLPTPPTRAPAPFIDQLPTKYDIVLHSSQELTVTNSIPESLRITNGILSHPLHPELIIQVNTNLISNTITLTITEDKMNELQRPVPVDIFLGQIELSLGSALTLRPGMKLEFQLQEPLQVTLSIAGSAWAEGYLHIGDEGAYVTLEKSYRHLKKESADRKLLEENFDKQG